MDYEILALIPARSGSKSVKDKNIRMMADKPMIAYSIEHALHSKYITRTIVSTDSEQYAEIARSFGAEVPFLRPEKLAGDTSLDLEVFEHALNFLKVKQGYEPDFIVQLRPTYPIRNVNDIDNMIEQLIADERADSIRCIAPAREIPYKMWHKNSDGILEPLMKEIPECYNMPRQQLPKVYYQNACIDVIRTETITKKHSMSGSRIIGYEMAHNFDIDTEEEFQAAECFLAVQNGKKRFVFDIDGVIAVNRKDLDYSKADPNISMIQNINSLYEMGCEIILFTARGYVTGKDWRKITEDQMRIWGVKFHELHFGKPNADYYVDDKMLSMEMLKNIMREKHNEKI